MDKCYVWLRWSGARVTGHAVSVFLKPREMKWPKPQAGSRPLSSSVLASGFQARCRRQKQKITGRLQAVCLGFLRTSYQDILGRTVLSDVLFWRNLMQHLVDMIFIGEFDDPNHDI